MSIAAFASFVLLTAFSPGPNNLLCMSAAIQQGFRKTLPLCAGMLAGFFLVTSFCALSTAFLYRHLPAVEKPMRCIGALYILYLAYTLYRSRPHAPRQDAAPNAAADPSRPAGFLSGMFLQCVNAKYIFYVLTALSTFILPHYATLGAIALFGLILIACSSVSNLLWAFFGSAFQGVFLRHRQTLNTVMALLLVYCAATLVL